MQRHEDKEQNHQKAWEIRRECYRKIEQLRERPLIVYATSTRPGVVAQMANDAVRQFIDQIEAIKKSGELGFKGDNVDVLIHSIGGDSLSAWKLMSVLRERFERIGVLVPYMAFSAATIFALGADEIVMHPYASLGPIDPQIRAMTPDGSVRQFAYEDVGAFLQFLHEEAKLTDQVHVMPIVEHLLKAVDPLTIGASKRASDLSTSIGERLLKLHMTDGEDRDKPAQIARDLNKSFFAHGDAVSRSRARELHLKIAEDNPELEQTMWAAFEQVESAMELRSSFNPLQVLLNDDVAARELDPPAPAKIPPDTPPEVLNQLWSAIAQQVVQRAAIPATKVDYSLLNAMIESSRIASEHRTDGYVAASLQPDGVTAGVNTVVHSGWTDVDEPVPRPPPSKEYSPSDDDTGATQ